MQRKALRSAFLDFGPGSGIMGNHIIAGFQYLHIHGLVPGIGLRVRETRISVWVLNAENAEDAEKNSKTFFLRSQRTLR